MTGHLLTDDTATPTTVDPDTDAAWLRLSAALTDLLPALAAREDLTVTCAPGVGRGAPGCYIPALAAIELDGATLGVDPATCRPDRPSDRDRYPAAWGVLVHEAAHAAHSRWTTPADHAGSAAAAVAEVLEESRAEDAHLARRPGDRHWLRAAVTRLILADTLTDLHRDPTLTRWAAAHAAGLLLARADTGVLEPDEVAPVTAAVTAILGADTLTTLRGIWRDAHATADTDASAMLDHARRWCDALGVTADHPTPTTPTAPAAGDGEGDGPEGGEAAGAPAPPAAPITAALDAVTTADTTGATAASGHSDRVAERQAETAARRRADKRAGEVFTGGPLGGRSRLAGTRPPTPAEQAAARRLARALRDAGQRERTTTVTTSLTPPGRLRMRDAMAADAQRAAGTTVTAEPFTQTTRRRVPTPPLRLGVACDVSGSMSSVAGPVASAAWILARAAGHIPDAKTATVLFGAAVEPVTHPGATPARVQEFHAVDSIERAARAIDALDGALDLSRPGAARLLVIVSDSYFTPDEQHAARDRATRLTSTGCGVLWLTPAAAPIDIPRVTTVRLTDPAATAATIAAAATRALTTGR